MMPDEAFPPNAPIEQCRGGWFVIDEVRGWSGPWRTELAAELARDGKFDEAHAEERRHRNVR